MKKIRIGIIGSGFGQYGLFPAFRSLKNCEVVAFCGSERPQSKAYFKKIGFTNLYSDWQKMLQNEQLDAIAIAVVPNAQYKIAKYAIKKGLHVFAEKPLTATLKQADELVKLAKKNKITNVVDFIFPEINEWQKVKQLIDNQSLGSLLKIEEDWDFLSYDLEQKKYSWKTNKKEGGGALSFFYSHGLNYLEYFAGPISKITSKFTYENSGPHHGETGFILNLKFKRGVTGIVKVNINNPKLNQHKLSFIFAEGKLVLENKNSAVDNFSLKSYNKDGNQKLIKVSKDRVLKTEDQRVKLVRKIASRFIEACLQNNQTYPSFKEGLRVQNLIKIIRTNKN